MSCCVALRSEIGKLSDGSVQQFVASAIASILEDCNGHVAPNGRHKPLHLHHPLFQKANSTSDEIWNSENEA